MDIIDVIVLGGGGRRSSRRGDLDGLAELLMGRSRGTSVEDLLESLLRPRSVAELTQEVDEAMEDERVLAMQPVTVRSRVQLTKDVIYIGPEGFKPDHPHFNFLIRSPKKPDRWRLWSICPSHPTVRAFHIKGTDDAEEAVRRSNLLLDIGLDLVNNDEVFRRAAGYPDDDHTGIKPKPPAAPAEGPVEPAEKA